MNKLPSVTKNLLAINVLMFLATIVMERQGTDLAGLLGLHFFEASDFAPYQFVTYMFMHSDISHLFFNMLALYMFGGLLEKTWGSKRFLIFYFVCGVGAAIFQMLVAWAFGGSDSIISRIIYTVIALAGVWCISLLFRDRTEAGD